MSNRVSPRVHRRHSIPSASAEAFSLPASLRDAHQELIGWSLVFLGVLFTYGLGLLPQAVTVVALALLGLVHSALGFYRHGGSRISAPAVFLLAMGLFGYFPTLYYAYTSAFQPAYREVLGLSILLSSQLVLYAWWSSQPSSSQGPQKQPARSSVCVLGVTLGVIALAIGLAIDAIEIEGLLSLDQPAGYAGVTLTTVALVQMNRRINIFVLLLIGVLFAIFVVSLFSGGGRLVLGSLAIALTMAIGFRWRPRYIKILTLAVLPPGVLGLAKLRAQSVANYATGYQETGLESVVWPQRRFLDVLGDVLDGVYPLGGIETFASTATIWVPRTFWPDKPVGFGLELTELYRPELLSIGHSEAALLQGEFVYSWSLLGLPVLFGITGYFVCRLDRWLDGLNSVQPGSILVLIKQSIAVVAAAGLVDLVWVGTFTYAQRAGFTCALLGLMYVVARLLGAEPQSTPSFKEDAQLMAGPDASSPVSTGDVSQTAPPTPRREGRRGRHALLTEQRRLPGRVT